MLIKFISDYPLIFIFSFSIFITIIWSIISIIIINMNVNEMNKKLSEIIEEIKLLNKV